MLKYKNLGFYALESEILKSFFKSFSPCSMDYEIHKNCIFLPEGVFHNEKDDSSNICKTQPTSQLIVVERYKEFTAVMNVSWNMLYLIDTKKMVVKFGEDIVFHNKILLINADFYHADSFIYINSTKRSDRYPSLNKEEKSIIDEHMRDLKNSGSRYYRPHVFLNGSLVHDGKQIRDPCDNPYQINTVERNGEFSFLSDSQYKTKFLINTKDRTVTQGQCQKILLGDGCLILNQDMIDTPTKDYALYISSNK